MSKKKKRALPINYCFRKYTYKGLRSLTTFECFFILGKAHPYFAEKDSSVQYKLFYKEGEGFTRSICLNKYYGNNILCRRTCIKKKFRNVNYSVIRIYCNTYHIKLTEEEFRQIGLETRWKLIEAYIAKKREENKDA